VYVYGSVLACRIALAGTSVFSQTRLFATVTAGEELWDFEDGVRFDGTGIEEG
jgi:hypothetical protein